MKRTTRPRLPPTAGPGGVGAAVAIVLAWACSAPAAASPAESLEEAAGRGSSAEFLDRARSRARAIPTSLAELGVRLEPGMRTYQPEGPGKFPAVLFFHGCSGPTLSHEEDWARFYTGAGVVMIAVDSLAPRGLEGQPVCDLEVLTGSERAADVLASLEHARGLPFVDGERLALSGFSHGAWTIWELFVLATQRSPPLGLDGWPEGGLAGVRAAFLFYGPCLEPWTVPIPTVAFLAGADRYIDEQGCVDYARNAKKGDPAAGEGGFNYVIFPGATHTFDHAQPNAANRAAGSVFDPSATRASRSEIKRRLEAIRAREHPPR